MRLDIRASALTLGILWGGHFLVLGLLASFAREGYASGWFEMWGDLYPFYLGTSGLADLAKAAGVGFLDGLFCGAVGAWLYNLLIRPATD